MRFKTDFNLDIIKTGDIFVEYFPFQILDPIDSIIAYEIRIYTNSPFSHTGLLIREGDEIKTVEAISSGLAKRNFTKRYIDSQKHGIVVLRPVSANPQSSKNIQEIINDNQRKIMLQLIYEELKKATHYDKKLLILIALACQLYKKKNYKEALSYLKNNYDNFWICSEWVQWVYQQFNIEFCEQLAVPHDIFAYPNSIVIWTNLLGNNHFARHYNDMHREIWRRRNINV